jgi:hypothetical protein
VPSPTNWPKEKPRRNKRKIHAIDWTPDGNVRADLIHLVRQIEKGEFGKVRAYAMVCIDGNGNERCFTYHVGGDYRRDELRIAAQRLDCFIERGGYEE